MSHRPATTQWSQVLAARDGTDTRGRAALESLCQTYWPPLYAYIRHQGYDPEQARDLTQGFYAELLGKELLADVDPERGRFRSFLLASLRHYLSHRRERDRALKRGGGTPPLSLDVEAGEAGYAARPVDACTPEVVFERRWAATVLERAMDRLRRESQGSKENSHFERFRLYLTSESMQVPYREVARELGMTEGAVAAKVGRLRRRFGRCLRAEVLEIVADSANVDDELRHLLSVVLAQQG
jgi:RNA polymerase sigma-70 factor (ECF subfamily)